MKDYKVVKILLIDPFLESLDLFKPLLDKNLFLVEATQDLKSGFQKLKEKSYDVIVLDPTFPLVESLEILPIVIAFSNKKPVFILSSHISIEEKTTLLNLGAEAVFLKEGKDLLEFMKQISTFKPNSNSG